MATADFEARLRQAEDLRRHLEGELEAMASAAPSLSIALSVTRHGGAVR
jgi:hypothetical protein